MPQLIKAKSCELNFIHVHEMYVEYIGRLVDFNIFICTSLWCYTMAMVRIPYLQWWNVGTSCKLITCFEIIIKYRVVWCTVFIHGVVKSLAIYRAKDTLLTMPQIQMIHMLVWTKSLSCKWLKMKVLFLCGKKRKKKDTDMDISRDDGWIWI